MVRAGDDTTPRGADPSGANSVGVPSLRVQLVLYRNSQGAIDRYVASIGTATALARDRGVVSRAVLAIGDSSPQPILNDLEGLKDSLVGDPFDAVTYEHFGANLGSAGGHNRLFSGLAEDLVLVLNPDTYASPRLVIELVAGLADPSVGIVEGRQIPVEHPKAHHLELGDTGWACGACFLARAEVVRGSGGFDPDLFFLYGDDVDFSWRVRLAGWRIVHRPTARVFHDKRLTTDGVLEVTDAERRYAAEAAVLLPWRYSRPDLAETNLRAFENSRDALLQRIARELRERQRRGQLPEPLDPDGTVAEFVGDNFAEHRFSYRD
jgi:GT2 family glycosyltransferase